MRELVSKRKIWLLLLAIPFILTSCWKDEEEVTLSDRCYISKVSLGTIKRIIHTKNSVGEDSVYFASYTGSAIRLVVDQRRLTIENRDSLLYGSRLSSVLLNVTYEGSRLGYRAADDEEGEWATYKSTDSLDLSKPLNLMVVSEDGLSKRIYTLRLCVHQMEGDSLYWNRVDSSATAFDEMTEMRAVVQGGRLLVLGQTANGLRLAQRSGLGSVGEWMLSETNLPGDALVSTLLQSRGEMYVSTASGAVFSSKDGLQWSQLGFVRDGLKLAAVSEDYIYALVDGGLYRSADAQEWLPEALDDEAALLPSRELNSQCYVQENGNHRIMLLGAREDDADSTAVVWSKMWNVAGSEDNAEWVYYTQTRENDYNCPRLQYLTLFPYDGKIIAIGGAPIGKGRRKALDYMYVSNDHGITWKPDYKTHLPSELLGVSGPVAATVDENYFIWLFADKQVWRGRLNRLCFDRQ